MIIFSPVKTKFTFALLLLLSLLGSDRAAHASNISVSYSLTSDLAIVRDLTWYTEQPMEYTVSLINFEEDATSVVLESHLPAEFAGIEPEIHTQGDVEPADPPRVGNRLYFNRIGPGGAVGIIYHLVPETAGTYSFETSATSDTTDSNPDSNAFSFDLQIVNTRKYDLTCSITPASNPAPVNEELPVTITWRNNGPDRADNVRVTFAIDEGPKAWELISYDTLKLTRLSPAGSGLGLYGTTATMSLEAGESYSTVLVLKPKRPGTLEFGASSNGLFLPEAGTDPSQIEIDQSNNTSVVEMSISGEVKTFDLQADYAAFPGTIQPGGVVAMDLAVRNLGPDDASSISLRMLFLPASGSFMQFADFTLYSIQNSTGWNLHMTPDGVLYGADLDYLPAGESSTVTLLLKARPDTSESELVARFAIFSNYWDEVNIENNHAEVVVKSVPADTGDGTDLALTRSAPLEVPVSQTFTYTVSAKNNGPNPTDSAFVASIVPPNMRVVAASCDKGATSVRGNYVAIENAALAVGETATVKITVVPSQIGTSSVSSEVAARNFDPQIINNGTSATILVKEDGEIVNPEEPCVDMPDLVGKVIKVVRKGKFHKKQQQWKFKVQSKVEVTNIGTGCAMGKSFVKLYLSTDTVLDAGDQLIASKKINKLCPPKKAGKAPKPKKVSVKTRLQPGVNPIGMYVLAVVDADGSVLECNENNNVTLAVE